MSTSIDAWKVRVARAPSETEVVQVMRAFVETLSDAQHLLIGEECRSQALGSKEAVAECAVRLTRQELSMEDARASSDLQTIASVFIEATRRLSALSYEARLLNLQKPRR
jgi:hypothetical protein